MHKPICILMTTSCRNTCGFLKISLLACFKSSNSKRVIIPTSHSVLFPVITARVMFSMFWHPRQEQREWCKIRKNGQSQHLPLVEVLLLDQHGVLLSLACSCKCTCVKELAALTMGMVPVGQDSPTP